MGFPRQEYWSGLPFPFPGSSWPRDQTHISYIGRRVLYCWVTGGNPDKISVRCQGDIQVILSIRYLTLKALICLTTSHRLCKVKVKVTQSCPALCDPMACIVHGNLQAKILEWVAIPFSGDLPNPGIKSRSFALQVDSLPTDHEGSPRILEWVAYPFSRGSSWPRNWTGVSCIAGRFFASWATREAPLII